MHSPADAKSRQPPFSLVIFHADASFPVVSIAVCQRCYLCLPQRYPRAGSQSYPSPAAEANADCSTTVYWGRNSPTASHGAIGSQTDPKKGWFTILRLYSPLPSFFTKEWRPSEIEFMN
jgi:hypothetical protein